jgi:hypothetical protein
VIQRKRRAGSGDGFPTCSHSAINITVHATTIWLYIFVVWPAPAGPMCDTRAASGPSSGCSAASDSCAPPANMTNVPAAAAGTPPLTGASTQSAPCAWARVAKVAAEEGEPVEKSATTFDPLSGTANKPWGPHAISSTASCDVRHRPIRSARAATSDGDSAACAPSAICSLIMPALRLFRQSIVEAHFLVDFLHLGTELAE